MVLTFALPPASQALDPTQSTLHCLESHGLYLDLTVTLHLYARTSRANGLLSTANLRGRPPFQRHP